MSSLSLNYLLSIAALITLLCLSLALRDRPDAPFFTLRKFLPSKKHSGAAERGDQEQEQPGRPTRGRTVPALTPTVNLAKLSPHPCGSGDGIPRANKDAVPDALPLLEALVSMVAPLSLQSFRRGGNSPGVLPGPVEAPQLRKLENSGGAAEVEPGGRVAFRNGLSRKWTESSDCLQGYGGKALLSPKERRARRVEMGACGCCAALHRTAPHCRRWIVR